MKRCHKCGTPWVSEKRQPGVKEYCDKCSAYLHCCLNCRFHDRSVHNQCRIGTTDWVADREGANFCDEFEFKDAEAEKKDAGKKEKAKDAIDELFGDSDEPGSGLDDFKKLFED